MDKVLLRLDSTKYIIWSVKNKCPDSFIMGKWQALDYVNDKSTPLTTRDFRMAQEFRSSSKEHSIVDLLAENEAGPKGCHLVKNVLCDIYRTKLDYTKVCRRSGYPKHKLE